MSKRYFTVSGEGDDISYKKGSGQQEIARRSHTAQVLNRLAIEAFESQSNDFRFIAAFAHDYSKKYLSEVKPGADEYYEALSLLFNRSVSPQSLKETPTEMMKVVEKNFLHYRALASGVKSDRGGELTFHVGDKQFTKSEIEAKELGGEIQWQTRLGRTLFVTDKDYKLKGYYNCGASGILLGTARDPVDGNELPPFYKLPATGKHYVWVITSFKREEELCYWGDHAYLGLEDSNGDVSIYGDYGANRKVSFLDAFRRVSVGVESPDSYIGVPETGYSKKMTKIEISQEQYIELKESAVKSIHDEEMMGTILNQNCTRYVCDQLNKIGIRPKTEMSAVRFFTSKFMHQLPFGIGKKITNAFRKLPTGVSNFLHFIPLVYVPNMYFGLSLRLASLVAEKNLSQSDISLFDIFFKPWKVSVYHPYELGKWQDKQVLEGTAETVNI